MKKIYLIDANSFIYRMFYWMPEFKTNFGEVVNAVFWIARFFLEQLKKEKPDYVLFIKDATWENFRHKLDKDYKATRDKMPDNLRSQIPLIEEMIKKMHIPIIEISGVEADDVIGTLAKKYNKNKDYEVDILSGDKDLYSLVSENVKIYDTMKKKKYWPKEVEEKFWIKPEKIIDYLAIVWDKADNIPGIDGFWPSKAVNLINIIWSIEDIYKLIDENNFKNISEKERLEILKKKFWEENAKKLFPMFKGKTFEKLLNSRENAFLSKKLATIKTDVKLDNFDLERYKFTPENYLNEDVVELFKKLEFHSLLWEQKDDLKKWEDLHLNVNIIWDKQWLDNLFEKIKKHKQIIFDTETTSLDIIKAELVGMSIYLDDDNIFYINRLHSWPQINDKDFKDFLKKLFNLNIIFIGHNIKYDLEIIDLFLKKNELEKKNDNKQKQISLF